MTELLSGPDATTAAPFLADPRVQRAIQLVWHEATLLDAKEYEAWQDLYTDDALYVIPIERGTEDFADTLNMIYDDARMRRMRVNRMVEGYSLSAVDAARTVRTVSRFTVTSVSDGEVRLRSAQVLVSFKRDEFAMLGAELDHVVVLSPEGDRIGRKVIRLLNSDSTVNASGYLL
jgi:3-phenylpropionate/cinnamic acid dioxygenase small subunit